MDNFEHHLTRIVKELHKGNIALILGAGFSMLAEHEAGSSKRLPTWLGLAKKISEKFNLEFDENSSNPLFLFNYIEDVFGRADLEESVREELDTAQYNLSAAHNTLSTLPWSSILTTNYDDLIKKATNLTPIITANDYDRIRVSKKNNSLFYLHGDLNNPHTLTNSDYACWIDRHPDSSQHLLSIFRNKTVIFAGYSINDPHIHNLLTLIRRQTDGRNNKFYGFLYKPDQFTAHTWEAQFKINVIGYNDTEELNKYFVTLQNSYNELYGTIEENKKGLVDSPQVNTNEVSRANKEKVISAATELYGWADIQSLYLAGNSYSARTILIDDIYVPPDLILLSTSGEKTKSSLSEVDKHTLLEYLRSENRKKYNKRFAELIHKLENSKSKLELDFLIPRVVKTIDRSILIEMGLISNLDSDELRNEASAFLDKQKKLILVGEPGQGKSTLLRFYYLKKLSEWLEASRTEPFPIYLKLADFDSIEDFKKLDFLSFTASLISTQLNIPLNIINQALLHNGVWLLDGFDELKNEQLRHKLVNDLSILSNGKSKHRFIISSRVQENPFGLFSTDWNRAVIPDLTFKQSTIVIDKWKQVLRTQENFVLDTVRLNQLLGDDFSLEALKGNALLLTLVILFYKANKRLPNDKWEFYEHASKSLTGPIARAKVAEPESYLPSFCIHSLLSSIAIKGFVDSNTTFSESEIIQHTRDLLLSQRYSGEAIDKQCNIFLTSARSLLGVFVEKRFGRFGFLHLTFQEYYVARELMNCPPRAESLFETYIHYKDWKEVLFLYAMGIKSDTSRLNKLFKLLSQPSLASDIHKKYDSYTLFRIKLELALSIGLDNPAAWNFIGYDLCNRVKAYSNSYSNTIYELLGKFNISKKPLLDLLFNEVESQYANSNLVVSFKGSLDNQEIFSKLLSVSSKVLYWDKIADVYKDRLSNDTLVNYLINHCNTNGFNNASITLLIFTKNNPLVRGYLDSFKSSKAHIEQWLYILSICDYELDTLVKFFKFFGKDKGITSPFLKFCDKSKITMFEHFKLSEYGKEGLNSDNLHVKLLTLSALINSGDTSINLIRSTLEVYSKIPELRSFIVRKIYTLRSNECVIKMFFESAIISIPNEHIRTCFYLDSYDLFNTTNRSLEQTKNDIMNIYSSAKSNGIEPNLLASCSKVIKLYNSSSLNFTKELLIDVISNPFAITDDRRELLKYLHSNFILNSKDIDLLMPNIEEPQLSVQLAEMLDRYREKDYVKDLLLSLSESGTTKERVLFFNSIKNLYQDCTFRKAAINCSYNSSPKAQQTFIYSSLNSLDYEDIKACYFELLFKSEVSISNLLAKILATQPLGSREIELLNNAITSDSPKRQLAGLMLINNLPETKSFIPNLKETFLLGHIRIKRLALLALCKSQQGRKFIIKEIDDNTEDEAIHWLFSYILDVEKSGINNSSVTNFFNKLSEAYFIHSE